MTIVLVKNYVYFDNGVLVKKGSLGKIVSKSVSEDDHVIYNISVTLEDGKEVTVSVDITDEKFNRDFEIFKDGEIINILFTKLEELEGKITSSIKNIELIERQFDNYTKMLSAAVTSAECSSHSIV